jgi:FkbM family methyltransferase
MQTEATSPAAWVRIGRAALFIPLFGVWWLVLLAYARLRGSIRTETTTRSGLRMVVELPDLVEMYLYLFGLWEPDIAALIERRLEPGRTFIDVGAHSGAHTLVAAKVLGPTGRVVAFEPHGRKRNQLLANVESNENLAVVACHQVALSDCEGTVVLFEGPTKNSGLASTVSHKRPAGKLTVRRSPPGSILTEEELAAVRIVKIDVEGGEPAVLRGFATLLDQLPPDVEFLVELSPNWWPDPISTESIIMPFRSAGFNVFEIPNNYWPWRYLWPAAVALAKKRTAPLPNRVRRLDIVLARSTDDRI